MPPLIAFVVSWISGLCIGALAPAWIAPSAIVVPAGGAFVVFALLLRRGRGGTATSRASHLAGPMILSSALSLLAGLGGAMLASAEVTEQRLCRARIAQSLHGAVIRDGATSTSYAAHFVADEAARAGGRVRGRIALADGRPCADMATIRVKRGAIAAGARRPVAVAATGSAIVTDRGLRIENVIIGDVGPTESESPRDVMRVLRDRAGRNIDHLFRSHAPLVRALLIADQDGIDVAMRERFADAGLVHMLSVSGMHVAIIASALLTLANSARLSPRAASTTALLLVVAYIAMLGAPAPAVRSGVMLGVVMLSNQLQRPVHPWTALALGAVIPTYHPLIVLDLGWQLSVSGMAALVAARALFRRWRDTAYERPPSRTADSGWSHALDTCAYRLTRWFSSRQGVSRHLVRECLTGVIATLVTAPLIAYTFGRVSVIAPLTNIVASPVVAFVQPALFLALLLAPFEPLAQLAADACALPLVLFDQIARFGAAVPYAAVRVAPTLLTALLCGVASAAVVRATASRRMARGMIVAAASLMLAAWAPSLSLTSGMLEVHMLDVGQGDALAIRTPRGRWVLVDAGRTWEGGDAGRRTVIPYIQRMGGAVGVFVLSHAHEDHAGGAASIIEALAPVEWWEPAFVTTSPAYEEALRVAHRHGVDWHRVRPGREWRIDGVAFTVLAPDSAWTARQRDANETSVVLRVSYGQRRILLTGDAEREEEEWLLDQLSAEELRADVLKLGHHGSKTSSTERFVDAVQPMVGLVSVGAGNRYGHPSPEVLERFAGRGVPLLRTDREGAVVLRTDGRNLEVSASGARWRIPSRPTR